MRISSGSSRFRRDQIGFSLCRHPKLLSANLLQDEPQRELEYSVDEWIAYNKTEGPTRAEISNLPAEGFQALYAIAKGKGRTAEGQAKGYGASKGKSKDK